VFITSTTRNVLPVLEIEGRRLRQSDGALGQLRDAFERYQSEYSEANRAKSEALTT
jgi:hypothetical protein